MSLNMSLPETKVSGLKFDGKNFSLWKMKITAYLDSQDCLSEIEEPRNGKGHGRDSGGNGTGSGKKKSMKKEEEEESEENEITAKSKKVYTILILCLQDEQLQLVMDIEKGNARGVWERLVERYERKTVASKAQARNALHRCKLENNSSLEGYINQIKQLTIQLSNMGENITDGELRHVLFNGLSEEYSALIDTLSLNEDLNFEDACAAIRDRYERIKFKHGGTGCNGGNGEEVNMVNENPNRRNNFQNTNNKQYQNNFKFNNNNYNSSYRGRNQGQFRGRARNCFTCKQTGHMAFYCPQNQNKPKCDYCRMIGHSKDKCDYLRGQSNNTESGMLAVEESQNKNQEEFVFMAVDQQHYGQEINASWIVDSGATRHITNNKSLITNIQYLEQPVELTVANNQTIKLSEIGEAYLSGNNNIKLENVTYAPTFKSNLISVSKIVDSGSEVTFKQNEAIIKQARTGMVIASVPRKGNLYIFNQHENNINNHNLIATTTEKDKIDDKLWHYRMGHLSISGLNKIKSANAAVGSDKIVIHSENYVCEGCVMGKAHRKAFGKTKYTVADSIMDRVHSDLCGPINEKYLCTNTDEK